MATGFNLALCQGEVTGGIQIGGLLQLLGHTGFNLETGANICSTRGLKGTYLLTLGAFGDRHTEGGLGKHTGESKITFIEDRLWQPDKPSWILENTTKRVSHTEGGANK